MKLANIGPIIVETDADDEFAEYTMPTEQRKMLAMLRTKEDALGRMWRFETDDARSAQLTDRREKIHKEILRIEKLETKEKHDAVKASASSAAEEIPESEIPAKIVIGKTKFNNPYFYGPDSRYAGDPTQFNWSPRLLKQYVRLNHILTSRGLTGFTLMYASIAHKRLSTINLANFVLFGAGGSVIWRRYDNGGPSGKNVVYVNGIMHEAKNIISYELTDPDRLDAMLEPFKERT